MIKQASILRNQFFKTKQFYHMKYKKNETNDFIEQIKYLESIIKYSPAIIYWKDQSSVYLGCNQNFIETVGYENCADIVGKTDYDLPWNNQAKKFQFDDQEVIKTSSPKLNIEDVIFNVKGEKRYVITNKVPLYDKNQKIIGVLGIATDITERKIIENELRSSKATQAEYEMLKNIIKYSPDWIYWKDKNSVHLGSNEQFAKAAGLASSEEMIGKTDYDLPWCKGAKKYRLDDQEVIASGTPKINIEDTVLVCDQKEVIVISNKVPLRNARGEIIGILGIATDITNQKNTEQALERSKEAAELALQAMKQAQIEEQKHREKAERLAVENAKHKTELEAQAAFTSTIDKAAHDIGSPMSGLVTTMECLGGLEDVTTVDGYSVALISEPERQKSTLYLQKKDTGLDFEVLGKDDALEKGRILWDEILTELKKNTLGDASDAPVFQKECLGILLNILINKDLIKKGINEKRVPEDYRIQVRDAIEKIKDITEDLISRYTKGSENKNEPKQLVLISTVLNQLISEKRMGFLRKGIELKEEFSPESLFAFVNIQSTQVNRAISNIMNNAAQAFDGKPGTVILKLRSDNESVCISICDNGKGMTPEMVEKIKNKIAFTEGKKDGHGIGLSQVRDTLEHNHGKMAIESEVCVGTTFTLTFSKKIPPAWAIDKIQVTPHDIILILDDDNSIHGAWDLRFKPLIKKHPSLKIEHFTFSAKLLDFLVTVPEENKKNLFLLTDYELLNQQDNGVQVMQQTKIKR